MVSDSLREKVAGSRRVCVLTGAGVSAESGIPTFRDADGLWKNYRPEDLATPEAFDRDPVAVWTWHAWMQNVCYEAQPNDAHKTIARMELYYPEFLLVTQNIDTLHERAGSRRMVKLHGDIMQMRCLDEDHVIHLKSPLDTERITSRETLPKCPDCGGVCRPNVVWFGEFGDIKSRDIASEFSSQCDLFLMVGTSGAVSAGYGFMEIARMAGAYIIEVNPRETTLSSMADLCIRRPAAEALPQLFQCGSL